MTSRQLVHRQEIKHSHPHEERQNHNHAEVSAPLLRSLLDSVAGLTAELFTLRNEFRNLQQTSMSDAKFRYFSQLPPEIRAMIWRLALTAPQIHIVKQEAVSRSRANLVMQACKEAREECLSLNLPYFYAADDINDLDDDPGAKGKSAIDRPKQYYNPSNDILYMAEVGAGSLPRIRTVKSYCGICGKHTDFGGTHFVQCSCQIPRQRLRGLAIVDSNWIDPSPGRGHNWDSSSMGSRRAGSCSLAYTYNSVPEIYIVVGDPIAMNDRDVMFVEPRLSPSSHYHGSGLYSNAEYRALPYKWSEMAARRMKLMEDFKAKRAAVRKGTVKTIQKPRRLNFANPCLRSSIVRT
jgi:hypothetical protein